MKKLFPAFLVLFLIPIAFACKKGTNSTGTVTNGVAYFTLTNISPATSNSLGGNAVYVLLNGQNTNTAVPSGSTSYTSDKFSVTEGQNLCVSISSSGSVSCTSLTCTIYYNGNSLGSKVFSLGGSCTNGTSSSYCEIAK